MGLKQDVDEINARYCKWIISFQLDSISCYAVWGTDLTDGENDKFWIDDQQRILLFREPEQLINALLQPSVSAFDFVNMSNWASRIKGHAHLAVDVLYDLNTISNQIDDLEFGKLASVDPGVANSLVNFINLFGDYAVQINDFKFISAWDNPSLKIFWEYMYNAYFWTIPANELKVRQDELTEGYDGEECRKSFNGMVNFLRNGLFCR